MKDLEEELARSLRRRDPSPDFADRVLEKIGAGDWERTVPRNRRRIFPGAFRLEWAVAACLLVALTVVGLWTYVKRHSNLRGKEIAQVLPSVQPSASKPGGLEKSPQSQHEPSAAGRQTPEVLAKEAGGARLAREYRRSKPSKNEVARLEGERAKRELMAAMYIASAKLNFAETRVRAAVNAGQRGGQALTEEPEK